MKVIGTAGHIDHGKSTLVHRLSGIDPDRLADEKRRGMTIDLGFAWLTLPSGREVSVVDVPGHERFIKNMLAGIGGIDVALLVVACDEGVMPQTREHLDILDLLGVSRGVVALTKADLAEEDWIELVVDDVRGLLDPTSLAAAPIVPVSAATGRGLDELLHALDTMVADSPDHPDLGAPFLPIDRVFTMSGFGTVVTGTLQDGSLAVGQDVEVAPSSRRARIRGLQTHRERVDRALPGSRVAVNLVGVAREEVARGQVLTAPGRMVGTRRFDAWIRVLASAPFSLVPGLEVTLDIGSAETGARLAPLDGRPIVPGEAAWVQLRSAEAVPATRGQRFILRLPAPARTVAGGVVLDTSPRHRRHDAAAVARLESLLRGTPVDLILSQLGSDRPRPLARLSSLTGLSQSEIEAILPALEREHGVARVGSSLLSGAGWGAVRRRVADALARYHDDHPVRRGMPREELRTRARWTAGDWSEAVSKLATEGIVRDYGPIVSAPDHVGGSERRAAEAARLLDALQRHPFAPPGGEELLSQAGADAMVLQALVDEGRIVRVTSGVYFERDAYHRVVDRIVALIRAEGAVTVAQVRDDLDTSRKYVLALLEHLDAQGVTRRTGDTRVLGSRAPACA